MAPSAAADGGYPFAAVSSTPLLPYIPAAPLPGIAAAPDAAPPANDAPLLRYPQLGPRSTLPEYGPTAAHHACQRLRNTHAHVRLGVRVACGGGSARYIYTPVPVPEPSATTAGSFAAVPVSYGAVSGSFAGVPDQRLSSSSPSLYNPPFTAAPPPPPPAAAAASQWSDPTPPLPPKPQYLADAPPPPPPLPQSLASADRTPSWPSWAPEASGANAYAASAPPFVPTAVAPSPSASFDGVWTDAPPVPPLDPAVRARLMPVGPNDAAGGQPPQGGLLASPAAPRSLPGTVLPFSCFRAGFEGSVRLLSGRALWLF